MDKYFEPKQIIAILLRWWWVLILGVLVVVAIAFGVNQSQTPVYEATTTIMVGEFINAPQISRDDIVARDAFTQSYAEMARREPVLSGVVKALNLNRSWSKLRNSVDVKIVENTSLIEISARANSPEDAQAIAGEVANQLISLGQVQEDVSANRQFAVQEIDTLRGRIEAGHKRLAALQAQATYTSTPDRLNELKTEIDSLERLVTDWEDTYSRLLVLLETNGTQNSLTIIEAAWANPKPLSPNLRLNLLLSAILGFILALGIIFLINQFDDRIRSSETLEQKLGLHHLGTISKMKGKNYAGKVIDAQNPMFSTAVYYKKILASIGFMEKGDQPMKSLLVTSSHVREGKTITVSNLGIMMARAGFNTIVVDVDWINPTQHKLFNLSNKRGFMDLLTNSDLVVKDQLQTTNFNKLQILTAGNLSKDPVEVLDPEKLKRLLSELNKISDVVILDAPSTDIIDSMVLFDQVDGVILVIESGQTTIKSVRQSMNSLLIANTKLLGGILNQAPSLWSAL